MSRAVDRLERAGLVSRTPDAADRRRHGVAVTEEAVRVLRSVKRKRTAWLAQRLEGLSDDERRARWPRRSTRCGSCWRRALDGGHPGAGAPHIPQPRLHRNYRLFFTGQLVSVVGTWMQNTALAWFVVELTRSPIAVGALAFCRFVPFTVFGLFAGVVADRIDNRRLVIGTQLASMLVSIALAALAFSGVAEVWHACSPPWAAPRSSSTRRGATR